MKYSVVDNNTGLVVNIVEWDGSGQFPLISGQSIREAVEGDNITGDLLDLSEAELRKLRLNEADNYTDQLLVEGFVWNGIRFKADIEHQMTYKTSAELVMNGMLASKTIKGEGNNFIVLDQTNALEFFMAGLMFIDVTLADGWAVKYGGTLYDSTAVDPSISTMSYIQLLDYKDPRRSSN